MNKTKINLSEYVLSEEYNNEEFEKLLLSELEVAHPYWYGRYHQADRSVFQDMQTSGHEEWTENRDEHPEGVMCYKQGLADDYSAYDSLTLFEGRTVLGVDVAEGSFAYPEREIIRLNIADNKEAYKVIMKVIEKY